MELKELYNQAYYKNDKGMLLNMDCLEGLKMMNDESVDLVVTSPPYDNLRTYNGYSFDFENIAKELFRIVKNGGVVVWVVGDKTEKGSETLTSFKQALFFKETGFNILDIFMGSGTTAKMAEKNNRRWIGFEISEEYCDICKERLTEEE